MKKTAYFLLTIAIISSILTLRLFYIDEGNYFLPPLNWDYIFAIPYVLLISIIPIGLFFLLKAFKVNYGVSFFVSILPLGFASVYFFSI
jgi:hypothetical protein